jgi:hypothetical protein
MSHLAPIYAVWDHNAEALASDIGEPGVKVRQWRNRENIPHVYWQRIIDAAARKGATLTLAQFIRPTVIDDTSDPGSWSDAILHSPNMRVEDYSGPQIEARTVVCVICEKRVDGLVPNSCTFADCPHFQRLDDAA